MKFIPAILFCIPCLLVTGCKHHDIKESDLVGSWLETQRNITSTNNFNPEHTFTASLGDTRKTSNYGIWALNGDHLVVTIFSNTYTTAVRATNDARIAKLEGDTLVLKDQDEQGNDRTRTFTKAK